MSGLRKGEAASIIIVTGLIASAISATMGLAALQSIWMGVMGDADVLSGGQSPFNDLVSSINEVCGDEGGSDTVLIDLDDDEEIKIDGDNAIFKVDGNQERTEDIHCSVAGSDGFEGGENTQVTINYESEGEVSFG